MFVVHEAMTSTAVGVARREVKFHAKVTFWPILMYVDVVEAGLMRETPPAGLVAS